MDRILRLTQVLEITGMPRSSLYRSIAENRFPRPVLLGKQARGWKLSQVEAWLDSLGTAGSGPGGEGVAK